MVGGRPPLVHALQEVAGVADAAGHRHAQLAPGVAAGRRVGQAQRGFFDARQPADGLHTQSRQLLACCRSAAGWVAGAR